MKKPVPAGFELSNLQRRYLGLDEVLPHWDRVRLNKKIILYFEGDIIRKMVMEGDDGHYRDRTSYFETDLFEKTSENRTVLLPKTKRGKPKKLNYTATQSFSYKGVYFNFSDDHIVLANYTTQTTFYEQDNDEKSDIGPWVDKWVAETTEQNLEELRIFKESKRVHQKYSEGDFFTFKIGRNKWGFGRILMNIAERRKSKEFSESNPGLAGMMGKPLLIGIYRYISDTKEIDINELGKYALLPTQAIMDNRFYYGEYRIIGNRPVEPDEWEPLISYSKRNEAKAFGLTEAYLQYGLICKEKKIWKEDKYLKTDSSFCPMFSNEAIGFNIDHYSKLEKIISGEIDYDTLLWNSDLRKKCNYEAKQEIFRSYGLDSDTSYAENLRKVGESTRPRISFARMQAIFSKPKNK